MASPLRVVLLVTLCLFASAFQRDLAFVPAVKQDSRCSSALFGAKKEKETELLDIAIIGGGPTGLVCALSLLRAAESTPSSPTPAIAIFESDSFTPKGASVSLQTNGWRAIKCIDKQTYKDMRANSANISYIAFKNFSGKSLIPVPVTLVLKFLVHPLLRLFRIGLRSTSWHAVRSALKRGAERLGSNQGYATDNLIRSKTSLVSVDPAAREDGRVLLTFDDGSKIAASTVLACDGTFSTVRKSLTEFEEKRGVSDKMNKPVIQDEQLTAWRGTVPSIERKGTATFFTAQKEANIIGGATAALFPAGGTVGGSSLVIMGPTRIMGRAKDSDDARNRLKQFLETVKVPIDGELMEAIDKTEVMMEHKIFSRDVDANPDMSSGYDRIAYVGDAAHTLRPTGESISLAMEDAWTLGNLVIGSQTGTLSPELLRMYEEQRQGRVNAISRAVRLVAQSWYISESNDEKEKLDGETSNRRVKNSRRLTQGVKQIKKQYPLAITPLY